jgi:hypothetical protein
LYPLSSLSFGEVTVAQPTQMELKKRSLEFLRS